MQVKTVAIIGAGFAGLSTAKVLKAFGFSVTVFEKDEEVGGVWAASRRYPGLTTQNPRTTYAFSDYPMPSDWPEWPFGEQVQAYLQSYTQAFDFAQNISLQTEVASAKFDDATQQWTITATRTIADGESEQIIERFDYLVVCNGIFSKPFIPDYSGAEQFKAAGGRLCHTSEFNEAEDSRDKDLVVVGYGKSSCDVATACVGLAKSVNVIARHLIWKMPKKIANKVNFKHFLLTRMGEGLFRYIRPKGFEKFLHGPGLPIRNKMLGTFESIIGKQLWLDELDLRPTKSLESIARSTVSMVSGNFYEQVKAGDLVVRKGTEITELRPGEAVLSSGATIPADIIVCGTGWQQLVPFLEDSVMDKVTDEHGDFLLYKSILPTAVPRLAFNGYNSSFFSQLSAEAGSLWIADYLMGGLKLPPRAQMDGDIAKRLIWMKQRTEGKHSHGTNIIPFSIHQVDEVLNDLDLNLGPLWRFRQWLVTIQGSDYKNITKRLLKRYGLEEAVR